MEDINNNLKENHNNDFQIRNKKLRDCYSNNRKDFEKRKRLRKQRLQRINEYKDEQIAALKH